MLRAAHLRAVRGEVMSGQDMKPLRSAWEDLCSRSIEDNVYYTPGYAMALQKNVETELRVLFATVWRGDRLIALLPFTRPRLRIPLAEPVGWAWQSKYTFSCTPVLDRMCANDGAEGLVRLLGTVRAGEWVLPTVNIAGEACAAMTEALDRFQVPWLTRGRFERASLKASASFDEHMQEHVSPRRRRELTRTRRKLERLGKVEHHAYRDGHGLKQAVSTFLEIEQSGWKGRRGTALACDRRTRQFALDAFTGHDGCNVRADVLTLDGRPIAAGLIVFAGDTGFAVKSAYDETYRKCSVGLLLEVEVMRSFLAEKWVDRLDAATAGSHVVDSLWPNRTKVADVVFSLSHSFANARLAAVSLSMELQHRSRQQLKRALQSGPKTTWFDRGLLTSTI